MFLKNGRMPVQFIVFTFAALMSWTSHGAAQQRTVLTLAEAEDIATSGEPGRAALLARLRGCGRAGCCSGAIARPDATSRTRKLPARWRRFSAEGNDSSATRRAPGVSACA